MDFFFNPRGIAVIGATPNPLKGGYAILKNLRLGYGGAIYPINPKYDEIEGLPCYPTVDVVPDPVDLAIVFVPAPSAPAAVAACAGRGIPGVLIESGGFAEAGPSGSMRQQALAEICHRTGMRIWGPNCMGLVDAVHGHIFSFMDPAAQERGLTAGTVSLVVQSGMLSAGFLVDIMSHATMGVSKVCSVGNKVDVNECDLLDYFLGDADTQVIGLYLESFPEGRRFLEICRRSDKPIVVLKGGKSRQGAEAAMSHTASLAGNRHIVAGALAQVGVIEADDFKQMIDFCRSLALARPPKDGKKRVAVLTFSGGAGIVATDFLAETGLTLSGLSATTKSILTGLFPSWMPVTNPVDLWPTIERHLGSDVDVYSSALAALLADPQVDAVFLQAYAGGSRFRLNLQEWANLIRTAEKPVFLWLLGHRDHLYPVQQEALSLGIPVFSELSRAVECLAVLFRQRPPREVAGAAKGPDWKTPDGLRERLLSAVSPLDEHLSKEVLKALGMPTAPERIAASAEEAETVAAELGYPVVLKGLLPQGVHKTDLGLVHLGMIDGPTVRSAYGHLRERMGGRGKVLVQKQMAGRVEIILGLVRDPQFGPCVLFGLGGVMAEIYRDTAFAVAPLSQSEALNLIGRIRGQAILEGFRGAPVVNRQTLAQLIIRLGEIGLAFPEIREIDINPLIVGESDATIVDATIVLEGGAVKP